MANAFYVDSEDLIGLGDGPIVRNKQTGELGLLVEVDDDDDAEIGYDDGDDDDDDDDDDWEVAGEDEDEDDDDEEVGRRRRKKSGGGKARRKARRAGRQNRREDRREARQERHEDRREDDVPDKQDQVSKTLVESATLTGAGSYNISIVVQEDFWIDDVTASGLVNSTVTGIRAGTILVQDWPTGLDISALAPTLATQRHYGNGQYVKQGLTVRITGTMPGAGTVQVQLHGRVRKTRCS